MVANFIPNSSRKKPLMKFLTTISTSWEVITYSLNDWNKCIAKAKLDDLRADYFTKKKKDQAEEQGISTVVRGREGKESGARSGREKPMYTPFS
jgi:hypothetical protein